MNSELTGIGRLGYVTGQVILWGGGKLFVWSLALVRSSSDNAIGYVLILAIPVFFVAIALHFALVSLRLENIGKPRWWFALMFVPIFNIYVITLLIVAPAGYHYHKQLDSWGGMLVAAIGAFITILITLIIFG